MQDQFDNCHGVTPKSVPTTEKFTSGKYKENQPLLQRPIMNYTMKTSATQKTEFDLAIAKFFHANNIAFQVAKSEQIKVSNTFFRIIFCQFLSKIFTFLVQKNSAKIWIYAKKIAENL